MLVERYNGFPHPPATLPSTVYIPGGALHAAAKLARVLAEHSQIEARVYGLLHDVAGTHGISLPRGRPAVYPGPLNVDSELERHVSSLPNLWAVVFDALEKLRIEAAPAAAPASRRRQGAAAAEA